MAGVPPRNLEDLTRPALIRMIKELCHGQKCKDDDEKADKEARDKADLHEEKHGRPHRVPVEHDDIPFEIADAHSPDDTPDDEESPSEKSGTSEDSEADHRPPFFKKKGR